ncbi:gliding motility-associated C-terminal domain-containing protein [Flavobacterium ardleyense]|uniref:Gliding motility-associated C-terminal domain-containing protein n=1 Tax=Flavobacterium ardleyense TaxID=2038737 RepID=A0ABW5Z956_9FLAO
MKKLLLFFMSIFSLCSYSQVLTENFDATTFPPAGWAVFDNGIGTNRSWVRTPNASLTYNSSAGAAYMQGENVTDGSKAIDWLVTPLVTVPADGQLRFRTREGRVGNYGSSYSIRVSTTSQNTAGDFTTVKTWTEADLVTTFNIYEQKVVPLTSYIGQSVYIAFVMENDNGDPWLIDNVFVDSKCLNPTTLTTTAVLATSVNLGWNNPSGATLWDIEWGPTGFTQGTGTIITGVTTNPYNLTGLSPLTSYEYYVRAVCSEDNPSVWSTSKLFVTTAAPPVCGGNFVDNGGAGNYLNGSNQTVTIVPVNPTDKVTVTFTSFDVEERWDALYVFDGNSAAAPQIASTNPAAFVPGGLAGGYWGNVSPGPFTSTAPDGSLTFVFRSDTSGQRPGWTSNITCGPPPTCPRPTAPTISAIGQQQVSVNWVENGPATQWQVLVLPANAPVPTAATPGWQTTSTRPYVYTGLNPGTFYKAYVRSICVAGIDESPVSFGTSFATQIVNDECINAVTAPVNSNASCLQTVGGTITGATASLPASNCSGTSNDDVWFKFTATSNIHFVSLINVAGSTTDLYHVVYSGTCNNLTRLYCSDDNSSTANNLVIGETYYIRVYSYSSTVGQDTVFDLCIGTPVSCSDSSAFCGDVGLVYPNSVSTPGYGAIGCLSSTPNPSWFYMQVNQSGTLNFQIAQTSATTGGGLDVDYIVWGPFTPEQFATSCNNLYGYPQGNTGFPNNVASCSYSAVSVENFTIPNAIVGNIYVVLITNYSNSVGTVTFTQTGGTGATDCSIVCSLDLGPDQVFCDTPSYQIVSSNATADNYAWYLNNVLISGVNTSSITVSQTGTYKCVITCGINQVEDEIVLTFNTSTIPTFDAIVPICENTTAPVLATTSTNGITGTWSPAVVSNVNSGIYTFTPTTGQCASPIDVSITVNAKTVPSFVSLAPVCAGDVAPVLPSTSNNGITGSWSPAIVDNMNSATYTFTPDTGQCASVATLNVQVLATCTFGTIASAVLLDNCTTTPSGTFFNTTSGSQAIGAATDIFPNSNLGTYVQASGNLMFNGAELRTFKTITSNVCSARLNYRVYEASATPGAFTIVNLSLLEDCTAGTYPTGGASCLTGDQRWQEVTAAIDLTANAPGNYIIEVYYDVTGDNDNPTECDDSIVLDNGGAYYVATFSIQATPSFAFVSPTTCNGTQGAITISGFTPGNIYGVSYMQNAVAVGPNNYTANSNGDILISNLTAGAYTGFNFAINGCTITDAIVITLVDPIYNPTFNQVGPFCVGDAIILPTTSIEGYTGTWSPAVDNTQTTTYTFTPTAGQCATVNSTYVVTVNPAPSLTNLLSNSPICFGGDAVFTITGTANTTVRYKIGTGTVQTAAVGASGSVAITVPAPAAGDVILTLVNIDNGTCITTLSNTATVVVKPLPSVTSLTPVSSSVCLGSNAEFTIEGTPNGTVSYQVNSGAVETASLNASGQSATITIANPTADVVIELIDIIDGTCTTLVNNTVTIKVVSVPLPTISITSLPTCADQTADFEVLSPINSMLNVPGNLFISEITDAASGSLTYVEVYNGTGATVDLSNYKLVVSTNGNLPSAACTMPLSGNLLNNAVVVIKLSTSPNEAGVVPDLSFTACSGVNNNDQIVLTTSADVLIDVWGINGTVFTPGVGYTYRRKATALLPSIIWDATEWDLLDPEDYSDVGSYTLYTTNYEYILSDGVTTTTQSSTSYTDVATGTYTIIAHDLITGCYSPPYEFTIDAAVYSNPVTAFTYDTPVCLSDVVNPMPDTSIVDFTAGGTFTGNSSNIVIDPLTGEVDLSLSVAGTYTITYTLPVDVANCVNGESSQFEFVISAYLVPTFDSVEVCLGSQFVLPAKSKEGYEGSWSSSADVSTEGTTTYYFTPTTSTCSEVGELVLTVKRCTIPKGVSPNNDGINDTWDLTGFNVSKVEIFNRYGTKVYNKTDYIKEWFGQSNNGNELPDGTYYYMIEFKDSPAKTGWVYINRER